jgi:hypothetical protein
MEHTWPALRGWDEQPDTVGTRRAVYGKVHRAPTDYRWIAWSAAFGSTPPTSERELSINTYQLPAPSIGWRCSPATGPFAVRFYTSRAFDAAGRPAGVEKQILLTQLPEPGAAIPPVALAFLLLNAAAPFDDTIWWDTWRDPAWASMSHYLVIAEEEPDCPRLDLSQLENKIEQGLSELLNAVDESSLVHFYAQLLSGASPAVLKTASGPLSPLAMAALLLPIERGQTDELSIAGGVSSALQPTKFARWDEVVCTLDSAVMAPTVSGNPGDARHLVEVLKGAQANGGHFPAPPSPGTLFLEGFLKSDGRWVAPGTLGTQALQALGPWPTVKRPREAADLRNLVASFLDHLRHLHERGCNADQLRHMATKYDLLQALLIVLCPGPETYKTFLDDRGRSNLVPALYFLSRIEPEDRDDLAARYTHEQFRDLAAASLNGSEIPQPLTRGVRDFLEQARSDPSSLMARYAADALSADGT